MASETTKQFICVLNKKIEVGRAFNALGHMAVGLTALYDDLTELRFVDYIDKDGSKHSSISDNPFIVLKAKNANQIRSLRNDLMDRKILFTDFTDTMTIGTFEQQHEETSNTLEEDLEYFGICFFMDKEESKELTKRFSLYT